MPEDKLLERITIDPATFGGKPITCGRRLTREHVLDVLAAEESIAPSSLDGRALSARISWHAWPMRTGWLAMSG